MTTEPVCPYDEYETDPACPACEALGCEPGTCADCEGRGVLLITIGGDTQPCLRCEGSGKCYLCGERRD